MLVLLLLIGFPNGVLERAPLPATVLAQDDAAQIRGHLKAARSNDQSTRSVAVRALGGLGAAGAGALSELLEDEDSSTFGLACQTLVGMGAMATPALPVLVELAGGHDEVVAPHLALAAVTALAEELQRVSDDEKRPSKEQRAREAFQRRMGARATLWRVGRHDLETLLRLVLESKGPAKALGDRYSSMRISFARAAGEAGKDATELLQRMLDSPVAEVRATATGGVLALEKELQGPFVPGIVKLLSDSEEGVRVLAAQAVSIIGSCAEHESALRSCLEDPSWAVRMRACQALRMLCDDVTTLLPLLVEATRQVKSGLARAVAFDVLAGIETPQPALLEVFLAGLQDDSGFVRWRSVSGLTRCAADLKPYVPRLKRLLDDPDERVSTEAKKVLGGL